MLLTKIDDLLRSEHYYLAEGDSCHALREYTSRAGYGYSETNQLILNFKKSPEKRGEPGWHYKAKAITQFADELCRALPKDLSGTTVVPMPPSKCKGNPAYDDRMVEVAKIICQRSGGQLRELLYHEVDTESHHQSEAKRDVKRLIANLRIDESQVHPAPDRVIVLDDVLTTGAHFVAARCVLGERFPAARLIGIFIARRVFAPPPPVS